jgi:hypothetical protein
MKRKLIIAGVALALAAGTGTFFAARAVHAGPGNPALYGLTGGTSKATNNVSACSALGGGGGVCYVTMKGNYNAQALPGVSNGTYKVLLVIDWATYAYNSNFGENCASASGELTLTSGSSTLATTLQSTGGSLVCEETQSSPVVRDYFLNGNDIYKATGIWKHINRAGSQIGIQGSDWEFTNTVGSYLDQGFFNNTNFS